MRTVNGELVDRSKRFVRVFAVIVSLFSFVGCQHFFGNDEQVKDPLQFKEQGLSCVRTVGHDTKAFLTGEEKDPVMIVDCLSGALQKFANSTRGGSADGWTRGELSSFFESHFEQETVGRLVKKSLGEGILAGFPFDGDWVAQAKRRAIVSELFQWKAALIGGGDQTISRVEIARIRDVLVRLRLPLSQLRGQGKLLTFSAESENGIGKNELEVVTGAIHEVRDILVRELSGSLGNSLKAREPMRLQVLASSLSQMGFKYFEDNRKITLLESMKALLLAGDAKRVAGDEWATLVRQATEYWIAGLRIQYGFLKKTKLNESDIEIVEMASRDLLKSLSHTIERHGGRVDNGLIEKVFVALEQNELLPVRIKAQSVRGMLGPVFGKFLAGNHLANSASLSLGLQADHITRIDEVVKDWAEGHRLVLAIMGNVEFLTVNQVKTALSQIPNRNKDEISERAHIQMLDLILRGRPLARDIEGRTYVLPSNLIPGYRVADLERLNLNRVLSSLILKGYARQTPRAGNAPQITSQEAQEVFSDVKSLGRDLGFVDVRSLQSGTRTFMEMGVFTSVSDGDQFISLREAVEWLEIVASSSKLADHIHSQLVGACGVGPLGVFGDMRLSAQCFRERLLPLLRSTLSHLPNVVRTINQAERSRQAERLIRSIEESVRPLGMTDLPIELSELRAMIPVLHYAESLFARFDVNQTGVLEDEEVWSIFPLIRPFIRTVATGVDLSAGEERAIFSWIVRKGEPPSTTMGGKISLKMYQARLGFLEETATVETILQILGSFQKVGRESKDRAVLELYRLHAAAWEKKLGSGDEEIMNRTRNLLQCADEAKDSFARLIQMRRADIFSRDERQDDEEQAVAFLTRFKTLVQGDPQLQLLCQAF